MVTGIDGQSPGMVEAQFRFRGGHAHKFAINKCHFSCRLKRRARGGEVARGDEARRHSCKRDRRWETHRADDMVHFWEGLPETTCLAWGLFDAPLWQMLRFHPQCGVFAHWATCDWQGYAHAISWYTLISSLTCMCVTHTFSHTQMHTFLNKSTRGCTHTHTCASSWHMSVTTVRVFGEIPRKICHLTDVIQRGVEGLGHLWVLWSLCVIRSVAEGEAFGACDVWFAWAVNHLCLHPDN